MPNSTNDENAFVLVELAPAPGVQAVGRMSVEELTKKSGQALDRAMNTIQCMAKRVAATFEGVPRLPSKVEVEFGLKLNAEGGAIVAKTAVEGAIKVKLTWELRQESHER